LSEPAARSQRDDVGAGFTVACEAGLSTRHAQGKRRLGGGDQRKECKPEQPQSDRVTNAMGSLLKHDASLPGMCAENKVRAHPVHGRRVLLWGQAGDRFEDTVKVMRAQACA
jgi:hypothetical protein